MVGNIGGFERSIRIAAAVLLLTIVFVAHSSWRWVGLIGVLPLAIGLLGWCPLYAWLTQD